MPIRRFRGRRHPVRRCGEADGESDQSHATSRAVFRQDGSDVPEKSHDGALGLDGLQIDAVAWFYVMAGEFVSNIETGGTRC